MKKMFQVTYKCGNEVKQILGYKVTYSVDKTKAFVYKWDTKSKQAINTADIIEVIEL